MSLDLREINVLWVLYFVIHHFHTGCGAIYTSCESFSEQTFVLKHSLIKQPNQVTPLKL